MLKNTPVISVVICTFNTKETTGKCLDALKKSIDFLNKKVEVIIVDNGSDGSGRFFNQIYPWVKVINPGTNTGFAKGNNIGIKNTHPGSKYILLLNSDAIVNEETLSLSFNFLEQNKKADVLGCKIKFPNGRMQPSAGNVPTPFNIVTWISGIDHVPVVKKIIPQYHPKYLSYFSNTKRVGWVMGAYFFARREILIKTNGLDENLFMYLEEVDLCKRINDMGGQVWYTPEFWITHYDKGSQNGDNSNAIKKEIEGMVYYTKKFYQDKYYLIISFIKIFLCLREIAFKISGNKNRSLIYKEISSMLKLIKVGEE